MKDKDLRELWKSAQPPEVPERHWNKVWARIQMGRRSSERRPGRVLKYAGIAAVFAIGVLVGVFGSSLKGEKETVPNASRIENASDQQHRSEEGYNLCGLRNVRVEQIPSSTGDAYKMTAVTQNNVKVVWQYDLKKSF